MKITEQDVRRVAELANLALTDDEVVTHGSGHERDPDAH